MVHLLPFPAPPPVNTCRRTLFHYNLSFKEKVAFSRNFHKNFSQQLSQSLKEQKNRARTIEANQPFVYVIQDTRTGMILFMGRVSSLE